MMQSKKQFTAAEVFAAPTLYQGTNAPLVQQFKKAAQEYKAYAINPDGSVQFTLDPWDGK